MVNDITGVDGHPVVEHTAARAREEGGQRYA
jgi:hypothetical protein